MNIQIRLDPSRRQKDGLVGARIRAESDPVEYTLDLPFKGLHERLGTPEPIALDFLLVASLCYLIDKVVPRRDAPDNWTRELDVEFPVSSPGQWQDVAANLGGALSFLTGDIWRLGFRDLGAVPVFRPPRPKRRRRRSLVPTRVPASGVCLFSGGLDSLVGAVDLLAGSRELKLLLVGHYDSPGPASQQKHLYAGLNHRYPWRAELLQTRVSHRPESAPELTLRSRSVVFMALALYAARALGKTTPVYAPENGLIAINVPLTPSRAGSCSTRTMHPFFLERLTAALRGLGFENEIVNPLQFKTKGECLIKCRDQDLVRSLVDGSVSCSHGTRRQNWVRKQARNCGYCVPCLFRRAALHTAGIDEGRQYGIDVCEGELAIEDAGESGDDLRAVLDWLRSGRSNEDISREIMGVAPVRELSERAAVVSRGMAEVRSLLATKATGALQRAAGIAVRRQP